VVAHNKLVDFCVSNSPHSVMVATVVIVGQQVRVLVRENFDSQGTRHSSGDPDDRLPVLDRAISEGPLQFPRDHDLRLVRRLEDCVQGQEEAFEVTAFDGIDKLAVHLSRGALSSSTDGRAFQSTMSSMETDLDPLFFERADRSAG